MKMDVLLYNLLVWANLEALADFGKKNKVDI